MQCVTGKGISAVLVEYLGGLITKYCTITSIRVSPEINYFFFFFLHSEHHVDGKMLKNINFQLLGRTVTLCLIVPSFTVICKEYDQFGVLTFCDLMLFHHSPESLSMGCLFIVTGSRLLLRILYIL